MSVFLSPPPDIHQPVVIESDGGGLVHEFEAALNRYNVEGRRVEIRGNCNSACTLALGVNNVCVGKGAVVRFHHAFDAYSHTPRYDTTGEMLSRIPFKIAQTVRPHIRVDYNPSATLTYSQLVGLGVPDCDATAAVATASVQPAPAAVSPAAPIAPARKIMTEAEARAFFTAMMGKLPPPVDVAPASPPKPALVIRPPGALVGAQVRPTGLAVRTAVRVATLSQAFLEGFARGLHMPRRHNLGP